MQNNDAGRIISVIDSRIAKAVGSEASVDTTWATVAGVSSDHRTASAYLYGSATASEGFRLPDSLAVSVGDKVKVARDGRGDRWIVEVAQPSGYRKIEFNPNTGKVSFGGGTALPDVDLYQNGAGNLKTGATFDAAAYLVAGVALQGVPSGVICMWHGTVATIPSGWYLCDGTNGTPDLQDRFIVGATSGNEATSGGTVSATAALATHAGHSNHAFTQPSAHSNHAFTQPAAHTDHVFTQPSDHSDHKHELPIRVSGTTILFWNDANGTSSAPTSNTTVTSGGGSSARSKSQGSDTSLTHAGGAVDSHSAHSGGAVDAHSAHSGGAVDAHSAHDAHAIEKYFRLAFIMKA